MAVAAVMKNKRCQALYRASPGPVPPPVYFNGEIEIPASPTIMVEDVETLLIDESLTVEILPDPEVDTETLVVITPCEED